MPIAPLPAFEQEIKDFFRSQNLAFEDNCKSFSRLDFAFGSRAQGRRFHFDAKEKRQAINLQNWPAAAIPQEHLFILDDLAARKTLAYAPQSGLLIRDNLRQSYHLLTVLDLFLMPKVRVNRPIQNEVATLKGKWLIDLRNSVSTASLAALFAHIRAYLNEQDDILFRQLDCYGSYVGETIISQGVRRRPEHWDTDASAKSSARPGAKEGVTNGGKR